MIGWRDAKLTTKGVTAMKTMKLKKFVKWVKERAHKVLSLSVTYYDEALHWRSGCGVVVWDKGVSVSELYPDWALEDALNLVEGGQATVVFSDLGEVRLRLRP
jgi:hypothetical protein